MAGPESSPLVGASARFSAAEKRVLCGALALLGVVCVAAAVVNVGRPQQPAVLIDDIHQLNMDNVLAAHAVAQFDTHGQKEFQDPESFHRASDGVQITLAKSRAETKMHDILTFRHDEKTILGDNARSEGNLNAVVAWDDALDQRRTHHTLSKLAAANTASTKLVNWMTKTDKVIGERAADTDAKELENDLRSSTRDVHRTRQDWEAQQDIWEKKMVSNIEDSQSRLAAAIVGDDSQSLSQRDELNLLKDNQMASDCITKGLYQSGGCPFTGEAKNLPDPIEGVPSGFTGPKINW